MKYISKKIAGQIAAGCLFFAAAFLCIAYPLHAAHHRTHADGETTLNSTSCGTCGGSGQQLSSCAVCGGDGVSNTGNTCQSCGGTGKRYIFCRTCGGDGEFSPSTNETEVAHPLASCGLRCIEGCGSNCIKPHHHKGFHKCGKGHTF